MKTGNQRCPVSNARNNASRDCIALVAARRIAHKATQNAPDAITPNSSVISGSAPGKTGIPEGTRLNCHSAMRTIRNGTPKPTQKAAGKCLREKEGMEAGWCEGNSETMSEFIFKINCEKARELKQWMDLIFLYEIEVKAAPKPSEFPTIVFLHSQYPPPIAPGA
ncbi:MAG: hypothetical protein LBE24_06565 [Methylobacillus sp.]|jgi:hypothetical protein|nr:hypothetical protein [Methylobacillus sp.]